MILEDNAKIEDMIVSRIPPQALMLTPFQRPQGYQNQRLQATLLYFGINEMHNATLLTPVSGQLIVAEYYAPNHSKKKEDAAKQAKEEPTE